MPPVILLIGTLDTKGVETAYLRDRVRAHGCEVLVLDSGILGEANGITADFDRAAVARAAGTTIDALRAAGTRGKAVEEMLKGVRALTLELFAAGRIHGTAALGGAEGSVLAAAAMTALPVGFPKLIVSPIASGHRRFGTFVGTRDVLVMHSIVDILGLNPISMTVFDSAAAAIAGMARAYADRPPIAAARPAIAATMLGNTTRPLMHIRPMVEAAGRDLVIFHANGVGGRAMEEGIAAGWFAGVLDYTLSEIAGNLFGGFHDGGAARLLAAGRAGIPQVVVPGCLDFIVFGARHEVPPHLTDRPMYYHNPEFTLVRLTMEEQLRAVDAVAERLNASASPVEVCIPARGISIMDDVNGGVFWDEAISAARIDRFRAMLRPGIPCRVIDAHINDAAFAESALAVLHALL
jgi:uncharacterized protein (UPF0261 family)